ncbi:MAG TPA: PDZ domain-containing protein, partial [Chitinophagaceae bacterium]|nr:PDZ domain-containing protein [Chitinophagaceae bacterium]
IDTANKPVPGAWLGIDARAKNDTIIISAVDWDSPAWLAGVRPRQVLKTIDGKPATMQLLGEVKNKKAGNIVKLQVEQGGVLKTIPLILGTQFTRSFTIGKTSRPDQLQSVIFKDWSRINP